VKYNKYLINKLLNRKHLTYKELIELAEDAEYEFSGKTGSHVKYKHVKYPIVIIVVSKHSNSLFQKNVIDILKYVYQNIGEL